MPNDVRPRVSRRLLDKTRKAVEKRGLVYDSDNELVRDALRRLAES